MKLFTLFGEILLKDNQVKEKINDIDKKAQQLNKTISKVENGFKNFGNKMMKLTVPLAGAGVGITKLATDAGEMQSKFDTVFGSLNKNAEQWSREFQGAVGGSRNEIKSMLADSQDMLNGFGATKSEAYDLSKKMQALGTDLASFQNTSGGAKEAVERLRKGFLGETENLKALGIVITDNIMKQELMSKGDNRKLKELTQLEKIQLRYEIAVKQSTNAIGDAEKTSGSLANRWRNLIGRAKDLGANLGQKLLPRVEKLVNTTIDWIEKFDNLDDVQKEMIVTVGGIVAAIGPLSLGISKAISATKALNKAFALLSANPVVLAITGITAALVGIGIAAKKSVIETRESINKAVAYINEEKEKVVQNTKAQTESKLNALSKQREEELSAHNLRMDELKEYYDSEIDKVKKNEQAILKSIREKRSALEEQHRNTIDKINEEYGISEEKVKSKTDIQREALQEKLGMLDEEYKETEQTTKDTIKILEEQYKIDVDNAKARHQEKLDFINEEYREQLKLLDDELAEKVSNFEDEIDKIDEKTRNEDKIKREQRDKEKTLELQRKIDQTHDRNEKKRLEQDLADHLNDIEHRRILADRAEQKETLKQQIKDAKELYKEKKLNLKEETKAKKEEVEKQLTNELQNIEKIKTTSINAENEKLAKVKETLVEEKREQQLKTNEIIKQIQEERKEKINAENEKYNSAKKSLDDQESAMDGYVNRYTQKLNEELAEKQRIEDEKLQVTLHRLDEEIKAEQTKGEQRIKEIQAEYDKKEDDARKKKIKEELEKEYDSFITNPWKIGELYDELIDLSSMKELQQLLKDEKEKVSDDRKHLNFNLNRPANVKKIEDAIKDKGGVPKYAAGTNYHPGGYALTGENGPELLDLPTGTKVHDHETTKEMLGDRTTNINVKMIVNNEQNARLTARELFNLQKNAERGILLYD